MKIVVCSDAHLDWTTAGHRRFEEVDRALQAVVERAVAIKADLFLFLGDAMNPDSGSCVFRCTESLLRAARRLSLKGVTSAWVAGNHDVIEDGTGDTTLTPLRALDVQKGDTMSEGDVVVAERPRIFRLCKHQTKIVLLPYCASSHVYDPVETIDKFNLVMPVPTIVAAHATDIPGAVYGEESGEMARGKGMRFPYEKIVAVRRSMPAHWSDVPTLMFNGHVHRAQRCRPSGETKFEVVIPGSLARLNFGPEERNEPGWVEAEI